MNRKYLGLCGAAAAMLVLILNSRVAAQAAAEGVDVCIRTVIPSLFPFFLLSGYLTGNLCSGIFLARLFRSSPSCGTVIAAGLLGGYPLGAKLATEGFRAGNISQAQADRLLSFCSQAGPSFLFGMVASQFPEAKFGWMLWGIQLASALSVAWMLPEEGQRNLPEVEKKSYKFDSMRSALSAMASVCGWVIVFSVILHFFRRWFLWLLPEWVQVLVCGLMELTNGCLQLQVVDDLSLRFLLAAVMLNFGGLCVMMQTASLTRGLEFQNYILGKGMQPLFALFFSGIIIGKIWLILPIFLYFLRNSSLWRKKGVAIR